MRENWINNKVKQLIQNKLRLVLWAVKVRFREKGKVKTLEDAMG